MKEAAGEANLTVIAIILIAVVAAVVTPIINSTMATSAQKTCCSNAGGIWESSKCWNVTVNGSRGTENTTYWNSAERKCNATG